ncbi:ribosomal protein L21, putative [Eimeria tenella]|uniref:Ribosomal protein L21, putative n=1 Tax=Eimeria tenella TaxID=5802 RepID=U6KLM7_EIMTE|nr:ribosomal protein L21, putative [Eimeria tenella]CDJ37197.1 ribosomal protein L21, putative [Eimeria tenella]|eukprot:XP_013228035.1 ribosomal protein L21, putative [Eimeria tenella]
MHAQRRPNWVLLLLVLLLLPPQQQQQQQLVSGFLLPAAPPGVCRSRGSGACWGPSGCFPGGPPFGGPPRPWGAPLTGAPGAPGAPGGPPRGAPPRGYRGAPLGALLHSPAQEKLAAAGDGKSRSGEYLVAEIGGRKRWLERGRFYDVNRVQQKEGGLLLLLRVLLLQQQDGTLLLGQPFLEHIRVWATVLKHFRGPKLHLGKQRPKKWRKMWGHRQARTRIRIDKIENVEESLLLPNALQDPLLAALLAIRRAEKPSRVLPLYKRLGLQAADRKELLLIGEDPLALLDPKMNQFAADRLAAGHTDILPILGEGLQPQPQQQLLRQLKPRRR